jgi:hypothetical protein
MPPPDPQNARRAPLARTPQSQRKFNTEDTTDTTAERQACAEVRR